MTYPGNPVDGGIAPAQAAETHDSQAPVTTTPITVDLVKLALRRVKDPEVNLNIVDLGLVYDIRVSGNDVEVDMSLTTPACPSGPEITDDVQHTLEEIEGVGNIELNLVWSPPWSPQRIDPRVRAYLGF